MTSLKNIAPVEEPFQFEVPQIQALDVEADSLIRTVKARARYSVTGKGLTVAVLDTGLRTTHVDFSGRVVAQKNFTTDNGGNPDDASDGHGHGSHVCGIIAANNISRNGIAPDVNIIALKVLPNKDSGSFDAVRDALKWIIDHRAIYNITAICMSLGDGQNHINDDHFSNDEIRSHIQTLKNEKVAVIVAAGNYFFRHGSKQGMNFPAILRETISVGAVYDSELGEFAYRNGAYTPNSKADQITPFSQRLHEINPENGTPRPTRTDIFAPGSLMTSSGILNDHGESIQEGTSQAAPVIAGVVLLLQEYHLRLTGSLPSIDNLKLYLRSGGVTINDHHNDDNVDNTGLDFPRVDAVGALENLTRRLQKTMFERRNTLRELSF
jgi:subtilisin family serine protease